jgi:SAM-dependent methyltransferase
MKLRAIARRIAGRHQPAPEPAAEPAWDVLHHFDEPLLPRQPGGLPVPPLGLRLESGPGDLAMFLGIGEAWAHLVSRYLPATPVVLDIGCGPGKLARFLALNPSLTYVGVDLFRPSILWCQRAFAELGDRFHFEHFDGISERYNPAGTVRTVDYVLPVADRSVDLVACGSLFTHLFEPDARHYLAEIARVLKPGGTAIVSIHIDVQHIDAASGAAFVGDEHRMDVDEDYFLELCAQAGVPSAERIGLVYGQVVHALKSNP